MKDILLRLSHVSTVKNGVVGLNKFSFLIATGEIIGIATINQQGIEDFLDIILHQQPAHSGCIFFSNHLSDIKRRNRTSIVDRRIRLVQGVSVTENLFIFRENFKSFYLNHGLLEKEATKLLKAYDIPISAQVNTKNLTTLQRLQIELLKELLSGRKLLILRDFGDLLSHSDLMTLSMLIKKMASEGVAFLYVGSYPDDFFHHCHHMAVYDEGKIQKIFYANEMNETALNLLPYQKSTFIHKSSPTECEPAILELNFYQNQQAILSSIKISKGECLTILDRDQLSATSLLNQLTKKRNRDLNTYWTVDFLQNKAESNLFFIPENAIQTALFHDCSYMFNFCFLLDIKLKKSVFSSRMLGSIKKEFKDEIGHRGKLTNIKNLDKYELLNLVYYRVLLLCPTVVFIFQPFVQIDMELQIHTLTLIEKLKQRGITVVILTSSLINSEYTVGSIVHLKDAIN